MSSPSTEHNILFLVDTEACVSLIKKETLGTSEIKHDDKILLSGITSERIEALGSINLTIIVAHLSIEHKFYVVPNEFPIPSHGILGKDFSKRFHCVIDYGRMKYKVAPRNTPPAEIDIQHEIIRNVVALPPRSETFKLFRIKSSRFPCVIESQDVAEHVYVPTMIAHSPETWVRVLNCNQSMKYIKTDGLKATHVNDYTILKLNGDTTDNSRTKRLEKLKETLRSKIPNHIKSKLEPLCCEFSEIFHLEGDKLSTNNFFTQELQLRDREPVYVKNYGLPQCGIHTVKRKS